MNTVVPRRRGAVGAWLWGIAVVLTGVAHAGPLRVQPLTQQADGVSARVPFVQADDAAVATRINQRLFIDLFERMAPARAADGLREIDAQTWRSLPMLDYEVVRNDAQVLSLDVRGEWCSAYCDRFGQSFAFDARTGRSVDIDDLLIPAGRAALARQVHDSNLARIRQQIETLIKLKASMGTQRDALADVDDAIALFENCLTDRTDPSWRKTQSLGQMTVMPQALTFMQDRCSTHLTRAVDDLGDFTTHVPVARIQPWLTAYGATLLLGQGSALAPTSPFGQVLQGRIGEPLRITLWLRSLADDGAVSGIYFYERFRKPIELSGRYHRGVLDLRESGSDAALRLEVEGSALRGTWHSGKQTLPLLASP